MEPSQMTWAKAAACRANSFATVVGKQLILNQCTRVEVEEWMQGLQQGYSAKRTTKCFAAMKPVLAHMETFSQAVTILTQSDPTISTLVWGAIKVMLSAASALSRTLETIISMLETITRAMPRFEEYTQLFPNRDQLQKALFRIYCSYLDFCLDATKFFSVNIVFHTFRSFLFSGFLTTKFKELGESIELASQEFEKEATLAHVVNTKTQFTDIRGVLDLDRAQTNAMPVFSVPWSRNRRFLGREKELASLAHCLKPNNAKQQSCVLHGMAGIGKTQTALEFCYAQKSLFSSIIWVPSETEAVLAAAYAKIIRLIQGSSVSSRNTLIDPSGNVDASRQWLCQNPGWLLVFDNVDDPHILSDRYWPACEHGSVLITTQDRKLIHRADPDSRVRIKPLQDEEGSRLLLQYLPNHVSTSQHSALLARAISKEVCGFPLDLVGLAGFMVDSSTPLSETLGDLQNHPSRDLNSNSAAFQYERPINSAFDMSLKSLSKPALSVLRVISMLSPDSIPESLFFGNLDPVLEFRHGFSAGVEFRKEIRTPLSNRHLIDFHESNTPGASPSYSIHRRLQSIIQDNMDQVNHQLAFDRAVALIGSVFPPVTDHMVPMYDDMKLYQESVGHVARLEEVFRLSNKTSKTLVGDMAFVELLIGAAFYLYEIRLGTSGLTFLKTATPICAAKAATGQDSAQWLKLWATALQITWAIFGASTGIAERQSTTERIVKVLELRQAYVEADRSDDTYAGRVLLANVHNDMTVQLLDNGEYDRAEEHVKTSIKMKAELQKERMMPLYQFAEQNKNLALVYAGQGRNEESVGLSEDAVRVLPNEEEYGVHTIFLFVHGICLANAGLFDGALDAFTKCYQVRIEAFGMHGMTTLHSLYAVAYMQYRLGRYSEARRAIEKCRQDGKGGNWPSECILRADYLLSLITSAEGHQEEAAALQKPLLATLHNIFAQHSPSVLNGRHEDTFSELDLTSLFDLLVPLDAGRFVMAHRIASAGGCRANGAMDRGATYRTNQLRYT